MNFNSSEDENDSGFTDESQRRLADALIEQCSGFTGLEALLSGRRAKARDISLISFEPGFVVFPYLALRDLPAGVAGRLGIALMGAATKLGKPVLNAFAVTPQSAHTGLELNDDPEWSDSQGVSKAFGTWGAGADEFRNNKRAAGPKLIEEGEGANSLNQIITALENDGFGSLSTAALVRANRAKNKFRR